MNKKCQFTLIPQAVGHEKMVSH